MPSGTPAAKRDVMLIQSPAVRDEPSAPAFPAAGEPARPSRAGEPAPESPTPDAQITLRQRALSPHTLISFGVAIAILWFVVQRMDIDPAAIWANIRQANPLPLLAAFALWYGSFFVRAWRWRRMILASGRGIDSTWTVPRTRGLAEIITLSWFANSLVPAKLGDGYRAYLLKRDAKVPFSTGFGTILAERFVDAMMLLVVLTAAVAVVFGSHLPPQATPALTLGGILLAVGAIGLSVMWFSRNTLVLHLPARLQGAYARLQGALFGSLRNPALVLGIGLLLWLGDGMRVWLVARSLGAGLSPSIAILVAVMGALLTIIPFTPAGLGVVELGIGSMLIGVFGLDPVTAGSIIVLDRVVAYWSLLVVGATLYALRTRRDFRELAAATPPA